MTDQIDQNKPSEGTTEASVKPLSAVEQAREAKKILVIDYLKKLPVYKWAAAFAGIDRTTLENWRTEDKEFSSRCETAKAEAIQKLGGRATPDFILKNVDPETFKDKKETEITGEPLVIIKDKA
jgi:hypothetical protein